MFSLTPSIYIEGVYSDTIEGKLWFDPAQNGQGIILGNMGPSIYWRSFASNTQNSSYYGVKTFHIEMTWPQVKLALENFTKLALNKDNVTSNEISSYFGSKWDDKSQWFAHGIGFGQEVYNPNKGNTAFISGMIESLNLIAK